MLDFDANFDGETATGTYRLPYVADENEDEDYEIKIKVTCTDDKVSTKIDTVLRRQLRQKIQDMVHEVLEKMKAKYHTEQRTVVPQVTSPGVKVSADALKKDEPQPQKKQPENAKIQIETESSGTGFGNFVIKETFSTSTKELFGLFTDPQRLSMLTCSKVVIEPKVGGKIEMFNGAVSGEVKEIEDGKKIVQSWRFNSWAPEQLSTVTMTFNEKSSSAVEFVLEHKNVPNADLERAKAGWKENFIKRIPVIFGFVRSSSFL